MDPRLGTGLDPESRERRVGGGSLDPPARALDDDRAVGDQGPDRRREERLAGVALLAEVDERIPGRARWDECVVDQGDVPRDRSRLGHHALQGVVTDPIEEPRGETEDGRRDEDEQPQADRRGAVFAEAFEGDKEGRHVSPARPAGRR